MQSPASTSRYRVRCIGLATVGLTPVARMEIDLGGRPVPYQTIVDGERVWRRNRPGNASSVWTAESAFPGEGSTLEAGKKQVTYEAVEDLETPAGKFEKCLRVHVEDDSGRKLTEWYAPGIGLVRRTNDASGVTETLVMVKRP